MKNIKEIENFLKYQYRLKKKDITSLPAILNRNSVLKDDQLRGKNLAVSWSGGKDSCLAFLKAKEAGANIICLFNLISRQNKMTAFHVLKNKFVRMQAKALGLPFFSFFLEDDFLESLTKAIESLKQRGADVLSFGYIHRKDLGEFLRRLLPSFGLRVFEPLCGKNQEKLLKSIIKKDIEAVVISLDLANIDKNWLGKLIDGSFFSYLEEQQAIPFCGEKGEFHSFVIDAPFFIKRIKIKKAKKIILDNRAYFLIEKARLIKK